MTLFELCSDVFADFYSIDNLECLQQIAVNDNLKNNKSFLGVAIPPTEWDTRKVSCVLREFGYRTEIVRNTNFEDGETTDAVLIFKQ